MDKLQIRDLRLSCVLGILGQERKRRQDVLINLTLYTDLREACLSDRIEDTVNYSEIEEQISELVEGSSFFLIERLAESIAGVCLAHRQVVRVDLRLEKPRALRFARSAGIEISRSREDWETQTDRRKQP